MGGNTLSPNVTRVPYSIIIPVDYTTRIHVTNVTIPPASSCCIPGLPSCNLTSATPIMTDLLMPRMFYWCMENHAPASTTLG